MNYAAESSSRAPQAPIGTATATAQDANNHINNHHGVPDKSSSVAAVSDASARGQTSVNKGSTKASNGGVGGVPSGAVSSGTPANGSSNQAAGSQQYTREAQQIVDEERAASEKLPVYSGLQERFVLLSKMGDGAFSNVYKARDKKTGQKVAIKVVRKYELNSNQVSTAAP